MIFKMILLVLSVVFMEFSSAQLIQNLQCDPDIALVSEFNPSRFYGTWYVVRRTLKADQEETCSHLKLVQESNTIWFYERAVNRNLLEEVRSVAIHSDGTAKFTIARPTSDAPEDFWILSTDYANFALAYACVNDGPSRRNVTIWQLGRAPSFPTHMMEALMNQTLFTLLDITRDSLTAIDHSESSCKTLPDIPPGLPVILTGQCDPNMTVVENFEISNYIGEWFEISSYFSANKRGACGRARYALSDGRVDVVNSEVVNQTLEVVTGNATLATTDNSARLLVTLEIRPQVYVDSPLWILATDYTSYAVSYTCVNLSDDQRQVNAWILSRSRELTSAAQVAVNRVINSVIDLSTRFFVQDDQSDQSCFYFPEPVPNQPVIFRGQCNTNISVMSDFDAAKYMGLWHNIESYPSESQTGTCSNARYTAMDGFVDVFNTQVIGKELFSINGVARAVSTDGSAKFTVSFPIPGTNLTSTADYWVLDTDYTSYALVYSCANINDQQQQITSWKLSRTKELSPAGATAINRIIDSVTVLDQRYFVRNDQSREGCFYFPEPKPGVPVVFPGQCNTDVQVAGAFDLTQFQGTWNEIQAYPKEYQPGQCISHAFTATSTGFNLTTSSIADQFLGTSDSIVTLTTTDGTAKFTITIRVNNEDVIIPYWILQTDYLNYALAYSCVNLNQDFRAVYSWKLSRTRQLSPASVIAISDVIQRVTVLDEKYFETVDQSDAACFHLPEIPPGQPIILNGQCNPDVQVVQNFNITAYFGRWRLIESYGSVYQSGTCKDGTYSLSNDGSILVHNTQVINQTLDIASGSAIGSTDGIGKLLVFMLTPTARASEYWILDTDYTSFAFVYSCHNINPQQRRVWSWKLSRSRTLSDAANERINQIVNRIDVLNQRYYQVVDHSDNGCFYYPTPGPNTPVIFRGQCDPNINVVPNFNATAYMNLWHDIASYPAIFQRGTCPNAFYTLNINGTVDVFNTEVVNQKLDSIRGIGESATSDGGAKLIVNFPIPGTPNFTTSPYWVLATDYQSFALVYSCVNLNEESHQVFSWKLSRTKQLTSDAITAISRVTNTIPVLDDRYFVSRDQSRGGCFYFPEPQPGVPVVFPGQCDMNIQAVPSFDMAAFQGLWHEIAAYPKEQQTGQCINHRYNLIGNNISSLISSNVANQALGITTSEVTYASTQDSSGRLVIRLTTGGSVITIPFWILATDYTNYTLAYSCVNVNNDFRRVYSWKLSRTKELTSAANIAINNRMAEINVLDNMYYNKVDQSDNACFYLPTPIPEEPVIFPGQCDESISVIQNFNSSRYLGRWRLIQSYPQRSQTGSCQDATYSQNADGSTVDVYNTQVINQELDFINGRAVLATSDGSAKLLVYFPNTSEPAPYWILDTDYESYALVYSCRNINTERSQVTSWKLSRTSQLTPNAIERINQVVNRINVLNDQYYAPTDQSDQACFYFPTPGSTPVIFRGQCDKSIPAMTNFNAEAYSGLWHDIASYHTQFQEGSCSNARYTPVGNYVAIRNAQVVNQSLDIISGEARLATTDGSAKLIVRFPVAGTNLYTETPYWVLGTDYSSYSLVYTCVNIDAERRRVWSWKLSRTRQLTSEAVTAINRITATVPVLDDRYYIATDQSREGCFYYPEPKPGIPVIFPGQCDLNIRAIPNFNMTAFQGVWHEIEAYPKEQQSGQCVNHDYTLGTSNTLNLLSSSVQDQIRSITNSRVTFASAQDSSGRLTITLTSGGSVITIPFWIINTEYTDYALAYSCVNVNNDYRGVFSWKLSRTQQLTAEATVAIDNAMRNIDVLQHKYYEPIQQTAQACFYLPEPVPGQPVTFIGQCDESVTVIQNFNVSRYLGRWRRIESYPAPSQTGNCNDATYSLNADGTTVDVFNTQVINEELDFINGRAVLASNDSSAKLSVYFPNTAEPAPYWVLDTDYDSFALVYSCRNLPNNRRRVTSWKLSRSTQLTPTAVGRISQVVSRIDVLNDRYFEADDQSDRACFYLPPPGSNTPIFRGQCDETIPVVTNFNAAAYLGQWHDVASYNTVFQQGSCNNAYYSQGVGVVNVLNTQVVNQTLDTMTGVARLAATDNTGKLTVTFPVAGTNNTIDAPYWILATDYQTYSLVYSCVNVDAERRQVWSWKLSRTKQLPNAAATAINRVIATVPVLDDRYYVPRDQSDQGCFYYPEPRPGVPVVFPGQCDQTIQAMANFNMNAFQGIWHEIEAYPKEQQTGQCINHQSTLGAGNILNLVSSSVNNEILRVTNSRVAFASPQDTSGRLTITLISEGTTITIPYWILSTDYTDYALAYSCVNTNLNSRTVYSWKLSRSKALSAAGNTAINNRMSEIDVLDNKYYERIDQSDSACFFLPDLLPGQPAIFIGQCDNNIRVVQNFRAVEYLGRWRMIETYPSDFQSLQGGCQDATYTFGSNGTIDVYNTEVVNRNLDTIHGTAVLPNATEGKLLVNFPGATEPSDYWILDTDYSSYALVYSCRNINNQQRRVWTWKLSRTPELTSTAVTQINRIVNTINVLSDRYYMTIDHTSAACFYYPIADGNPVDFRGQCDESIPVVAAFNVTAYSGLWHNIESYPTQFAQGTCGNAHYAPNDLGVDVLNTQVVNQKLDTINGTAILASADISGKLTVRFPFSESPYWVLATDYTSYSFVYTCINLNSERQRVSSWKLSRTRQLTSDAATAIDRVVRTVPVLDNRYYNLEDQSDRGCFYYPEPEPGVPVVFRGQCDNNIQAVANFNMTAFQGLWHEIEAYPKEQQSGHCVNHDYTMGSSNTLDLVSSNIVEQIRSITNSRVTFASAQETSGRLTITLTSGASTITIPFWILSVDYRDYVLAYSCVNLNENSRAVYSWKLSRSQQLSPAGSIAINNKINEIDVLHGQYYEKVDQTDTACFYLPDLLPGQPAVFVGQCDNNLTVVQNFNAPAYEGRWRMIETYPSDFQSLQGGCQEATYTLAAGAIVEIFNTQVVNQNLDTINGTATLATTDGSGKLLVKFPGNPDATEYWILDTDYNSYALVYSCSNINSRQRRVWTWKLSRTRELTENAITRINRVVNKIDVLNERFYMKIDHSDNACFYYPAPDDNPVVFRGQCDESIPAVPNFNAEAYRGTWYDIESYPAQFQDGTCPTATYSLTPTGVDVYNTQVVAQRLDSVRGSAVLATNDSTARLIVSFPIAGTNITTSTPYWVLSTDYTNFALVYSCVNIDSERRKVGSWKLSRTKTLTSASQTAIDNVIRTIPVLRQDYYVRRGHTEDHCFYYPDNEGGPVVQNGQCEISGVNIVQQFNISSFAGSWYEISRFPSEIQDGECVSSEFTVDNEIVHIRKMIVANERLTVSAGPATMSPDGRGIMTITLTDSVAEGILEITLYVLDVVYNDFALLYGCRNIDNTRKQIYSWKLSRSQTGLSQTAVSRINQVVRDTRALFEDYFEITDQTLNGCFYYPTFDVLPPVIELLGPCDTSIRGVGNFNVQSYLGKWYDIASYPQPFQTGQCARAQYSAGVNGVNVLNSQVINRTLDIQMATAVVASTDGSGVLDVTFTLDNGVVNVVKYYVLETDYTSFSLVYSCRNMPNGTRLVSSWKLSREATLPAHAISVINEIINNTQGLIQEYYQDTDQTEEACFYIPNVNKNEAPLFRGQCEDISGIEGFDTQRYLGWWHEIESYPTDNHRGVCASSEFVQAGDEYRVTDINIFNNVAQINTSVVTVSNNGRMRKTYDNGEVIDLWILATDYETYSLLYSCENVDRQFMRVWSAKHSKTRQLTEAAEQAMAPIIGATRTLEAQFYLSVDQSDRACFHLPEQTGNQIVIPGQCDLNIPVVQKFDTKEYTGTWYQIERYSQVHENGTCVGARYTLDENSGIITVLNWQVVDEYLDTVEGTARIISTDGSAKLLVNLPIRFTEDPEPSMVAMNLYVLKTDYITYSLAYSCVNVGPYRRAVGVWKLSRTRELSDEGRTEIDTYMSTREELHQPYFIQVEQSDDCEEPNSAILIKSSIMIVLFCNILLQYLL